MVICRVLLWKGLLGVSRYLITPPGLGRYSKIANIKKKFCDDEKNGSKRCDGEFYNIFYFNLNKYFFKKKPFFQSLKILFTHQ